MRLDPYTIEGVVGNAIISQNGQLTVLYRMSEPECYSLSQQDLCQRILKMADALTNMPEKTWVHKQDVFLKRNHIPEEGGESFIAKAEWEHFNGRPKLEHICVLAFGVADLKSLSAAYQMNPFAYEKQLHKEDEERLTGFLSAVENCITVINSMDSQTRLRIMKENEVRSYLDTFTSFFSADGSILTPSYGGDIRAGDLRAKYYALCDDSFFPNRGTISTDIQDDTLPKSLSSLFMNVFEEMGVHLFANHVYNQIIYFEGDRKLRDDLDRNRRLYGANKKFDQELERKSDEMEKLEKEIMEDKDVMCMGHFNVMLWDENEETLRGDCKKVKEVMAKQGFSYLDPSDSMLCHIHMGSIIGQESGLQVPGDPHRFLFMAGLRTMLCFWISYTTFQDDKEGIFFNDRKYQCPLKIDIWDARRRFMDARNAMVIASTGGGKSATAQNIVQQLIEQEYVVVIVEFGNSFKNLCKLYPERSLHIEYDGSSPLGINPFDLEGRELDNEKIESLSNIIQRYWRRILNKQGDAEQKTCLDLLIRDYYEQQKKQGKKDFSFAAFYRHVIGDFKAICQRHQEVNVEKYFDVDSFKSVCSEFLPGHRYASVVSTEYLQPLSGKNLIVFELSQIKANAFLSSLVMNILFDVINTKILSDRGKRGYLIFDEYAEAAKMRDKAADTSIHGTVAYCYQTIRKHNGAVMTVVQTPSQLPHGNEPGASDTDNIIANTQLLIVLPTTGVVYADIIKYFRMENEAQVNLMKSIRNNFGGKRPYSELFLRFQEKRAIAVRSEFSRAKFLAFQTDGETTVALDRLEKQTGSRQKAIEAYIRQEQKGGE